ncbi:MAG: SDR family oxidoreductase [Clostridium sp.]|nr:SDR family oxidoreductase [Clostridium sp.]MCM1560257.1 SDR family oxidoreductase [Butyrivibrio sp.]
MVLEKFRISGKIVIITGGAGLLGQKHAEAVIEGGGIPVLLDISEEALEKAQSSLTNDYPEAEICVYKTDITNRDVLENLRSRVIEKYGHVDVLINNAANNPKVEAKGNNFSNIRFDNFPLETWNEDIMVGLTGAFLCAQVFGTVMEEQRSGIILNISSDLGVIAPDQRIYRKEGLDDREQTIKPVTYSVIKHGLLGLTKYLATYWADKNIRVNAICPGGIYNGQEKEFLGKLTNLIPMGRMADKDEYKATVLYMISEASSYMTGSTVIIDGGRTCW